MSLGRITIWSSGQVLTAAALNAEFNNILTNALQLISPLTGNLNVDSNQLLNVRVENRSSAPNAGNPGRLSFDLGTNTLWVDAGSLNLSAVSQPRQRVSGLKGQTSTGSTLISLHADSYLCQTTDRAAATESIASSAITCFLASSDGGPGKGAGGRDQAGQFSPGDFVHLYAITTGMFSTQPALIASLTAPPGFPTMSTSQTYNSACYLHTIPFTSGFSTGNPTPVPFGFFSGAEFHYNELQSVVNTHTSLTAQPAFTAEPVLCTSAVPPNAVSYRTHIRFGIGNVTSPTPPFTLYIYYQVSTSDLIANLTTDANPPTPSDYLQSSAHSGTNPVSLSGRVTIPVHTTDPKFFIVTTMGVGTTPASPWSVTADVMSYRVGNGDI